MGILPSHVVPGRKRSPAGFRILLLLALAAACGNGSGGGGTGAGGSGGSDSGTPTPDAGADVSIGRDAGDDGSVADDARTDGSIRDATIELPPGSCGLPPRVVQPPVTGRGPAKLGMADSDLNGLLDVDEWGPQTFTPLDTDFDGQPDYQDLDDDGDGLLDVHDAARLEALVPGTTPTTSLSLSVLVGPTPGIIKGAVRRGDRVTLNAPGIGCSTIVLLEGPGTEPLNFLPALDGGVVYFDWPAGNYRSVSVVIDGRRSDAVNLDVRPMSAPLLAPPAGLVNLGAPIKLAGLTLAGVTAVSIDGVDVATSVASNDNIGFTLPATTRRGRVVANSVAGSSNEVFLNITHTLALTFAPAPSVSATFETASGSKMVPLMPMTATPVDVDALGPAMVTVLGTRTDGSLVVSGLAWVVPSDNAVTVDMTSTALSLALVRVVPIRQLVPASWPVFRGIALGLPEVQALATVLAANAPSADAAAGGLGLDQQATVTAVDTAALAVQDALDAGLAAGTLKGPARPKKAAQDPGEPIIDPPTRSDVTPSGYGSDGNIKIENDTSMFLSPQIRDNDTKRILVAHATTPFHPKFIGPQDGLGVSPEGVEVFGASEKEFKAPSFRNAKLRVITAGEIGPKPSDPADEAAQMAVWLTTVIDRVLAPIVKEAIGHKVELETLGELLVTHAYPTVVEGYQAFKANGFAAAALTLLHFFEREFKEQGPFFKELSKALFVTFLEAPGSDRLKGFAMQGALHLVPAIEAFNKAATGVTILKAYFDINTTPGILDFDVAFKMSVVDLGPKSIERSNSIDVPMELEGYFLYPVTQGADFLVPSVQLVDSDPGGASTVVLRHDVPEDDLYISSNGRVMRFKIPRGYAAKAGGPIAVTVLRGSESARSPVDVLVTSDFNLDSITPTSGLPGAMMTLVGKGFAKDPSTVKVVFTASTGFTDVFATPTTATDEQITALVPALDESIAQWIVRVQRGVVGAEKRTNGKLFRRTQAGPEGTWIHYYANATTGSCAEVGTTLDKLDVFPNGNVRWYQWDAGGGYCVRDDKIFRPASGTLQLNGETVTVTQCSESITDPPRSATANWDAAAKAYVVPAGTLSGSTTCLKQTVMGSLGPVCVAKEACKVVQNTDGASVRFHCSRVCFSSPTLCPFAAGVEAECY